MGFVSSLTLLKISAHFSRLPFLSLIFGCRLSFDFRIVLMLHTFCVSAVLLVRLFCSGVDLYSFLEVSNFLLFHILKGEPILSRRGIVLSFPVCQSDVSYILVNILSSFNKQFAHRSQLLQKSCYIFPNQSAFTNCSFGDQQKKSSVEIIQRTQTKMLGAITGHPKISAAIICSKTSHQRTLLSL